MHVVTRVSVVEAGSDDEVNRVFAEIAAAPNVIDEALRGTIAFSIDNEES
ncbi:hypothetical protein [Paenibacillus hexagrammi]|uniref:Antibiotic biosynthesis monooxygenase n=1 Tax=Paenibacillus hexagrammi TaxID=2908839 RepID=A0ABY3SBW6_9BACL|nr:hypothetical protein L0M14_16540 [Paenibacillus sp. YPD9-1]